MSDLVSPQQVLGPLFLSQSSYCQLNLPGEESALLATSSPCSQGG